MFTGRINVCRQNNYTRHHEMPASMRSKDNLGRVLGYYQTHYMLLYHSRGNQHNHKTDCDENCVLSVIHYLCGLH